MAVTSPEELAEIERNLEPIESYEVMFSDRPRIPRASKTTGPKVNISKFTDGSTPEVITESSLKRDKAAGLLKAAIQVGNVIELDTTPRETVFTTERALLRYGHMVAEEQGLPADLAEMAEIQVNDLMIAEGSSLIDAPSLALGTLALARMEQIDDNLVERKAAARALGSLPRDPEKLEILRRQELGHDTGELAVRAIYEHEPVSA